MRFLLAGAVFLSRDKRPPIWLGVSWLLRRKFGTLFGFGFRFQYVIRLIFFVLSKNVAIEIVYQCLWKRPVKFLHRHYRLDWSL